MRASRLLALVTVGVIGCGGGGGNGNPTAPPVSGASNGTFTASINGSTWGAIGTVAVTKQAGNYIGLAATGMSGSTTYSFVLGIGNATGPGTHNLNLLAGGDGSSLIIGSSTSAGWGTGFSGGSGTVIITSLTANRIVGTFTATAVPSHGSTTNLVITNGTFDLTF